MDHQFTLAEVTRLIHARYADQAQAKNPAQWRAIQSEIDALRVVQKQSLDAQQASR